MKVERDVWGRISPDANNLYRCETPHFKKVDTVRDVERYLSDKAHDGWDFVQFIKIEDSSECYTPCWVFRRARGNEKI